MTTEALFSEVKVIPAVTIGPSEDRRERLRSELETRLPRSAEEQIRLNARAWAVLGIK